MKMDSTKAARFPGFKTYRDKRDDLDETIFTSDGVWGEGVSVDVVLGLAVPVLQAPVCCRELNGAADLESLVRRAYKLAGWFGVARPGFRCWRIGGPGLEACREVLDAITGMAEGLEASESTGQD